MDSSFLTGLHVCLSLFTMILFFKMIIQFGLPNHPARFVCYMVGLCIVTYFSGLAATDLNLISPWDWMSIRALPIIAGGLCLLLQTVMLIGTLSVVQQKIISRLPLMGALVGFAFFSTQANWFLGTFLTAGALFLIISVRKARYQKRLFLKMTLMMGLMLALSHVGTYILYLVGQLFLFAAVFYAFAFEHSFGVAALVDDFKQSLEGDS